MGKGGVQIYRGYSKNIPGTLPSLLKKCLTDLRHRDSRNTVVGIVAEAGIGTVLPTTRHTCAVPGCDVTLLDHNHAINHSSYHMLHTPSALGKAESCALCLGPASDCPSFLLFVQRSLRAQASDPQSGVKFTAAGMRESTAPMLTNP